MADHAGQTLQDARNSLGVVQVRPFVRDAVDLVSDKSSCQSTMCQAISGISSDDIDLIASLIFPDEGHVIDWLKDLTTPLVVHCRRLRKPFSSPDLELFKSREGVFLSHLVVASSHHHVVVLVITRRQADIFVLLCVVVEKAVLDAALWHSDRDAVRSIKFQLCDDTEFLQWDTSRLDRIFGFDGMTFLGFDFDALVAEAENFDSLLGDRHRAGSGIALEVGLGFQPCEDADKVFGWVEGRLVVGY